ncbi:MAG: hypothetical protein AAFV53_17220 [Myxococcota bacterium]
MISAAQSSMQRAYCNGGPGVFVSGVVWLSAGAVLAAFGFIPGMTMFFFGGMAIHPLSVWISNRVRQGAPQVVPDPGLSRLAMATLPLLFGGLFLGWFLALNAPLLFFPTVAVGVGLRYMLFSRVYGRTLFIVLGGVLVSLSVADIVVGGTHVLFPVLVGLLEVGCGALLGVQPYSALSP